MLKNQSGKGIRKGFARLQRPFRKEIKLGIGKGAKYEKSRGNKTHGTKEALKFRQRVFGRYIRDRSQQYSPDPIIQPIGPDKMLGFDKDDSANLTQEDINFIRSLKGKGKGKLKFDGNCNFCGKYGHMEKTCWNKQKELKGKGKNAQNVMDEVKGKGPKDKPEPIKKK